MTGLLKPIWILSTDFEPSQFCQASKLFPAIWRFPIASNRNALALYATISGFGILPLKIISFRASHNFHQINFGIACQIFLQAWLEERAPRYLDCQFLKRITGSAFRGKKENDSPHRTKAQTFWAKTHSTKMCTEESAAWKHRQHLMVHKNLFLTNFHLLTVFDELQSKWRN